MVSVHLICLPFPSVCSENDSRCNINERKGRQYNKYLESSDDAWRPGNSIHPFVPPIMNICERARCVMYTSVLPRNRLWGLRQRFCCSSTRNSRSSLHARTLLLMEACMKVFSEKLHTQVCNNQSKAFTAVDVRPDVAPIHLLASLILKLSSGFTN
jgi:hypothetical protein